MKGAVLVTGCSSGIGRACADRLSRGGFRVFAGVREVSDASPASGTPIVLDVSSGDSVARAAAFVGAHLEGLPLAGIVNNPGVSTALGRFLPARLRDRIFIRFFGFPGR